MKKILITGHKGFVGKYFINYINSFYPNVEIVGLDIKDGIKFDCRNFFKTSNEVFDLVIHLAAIVGGRSKIENDPLSVATDLSIDSEMFNWAVRTKQKKVVYFSSSAAYPVSLQSLEQKYKLREQDINLSDIRTPDFSYGWSKLSGEMLADYANQKYGLDVFVFRPFSGYGFDQDLDYPFPSFLNRVLTKVDQFEIWGSGEQVRDFIHISDVVASVFAAIDNNIKGPINLGTGRPISFNELSRIMFDIFDFQPKFGVKHLLDKPQGVMYRCSDNSLLKQFYNIKYPIEDVLESYKRCL